MTRSNIDKVVAVIEAIDSGDADLAVRDVDPKTYTEHNPYSEDGIDGLRRYIERLSTQDHRLKIVRAFQDGQYVFTHLEGLIRGQGVFFGIFRLEAGLIVEHWVFATEAAPPNESKHTQTDGPTQAKDLERTEANKSLVRGYYETIHVSGDHSKIPGYFSGDHCIRHEPGVRDGVANFKHDLEELVRHRSIDEIKFLFGQGDFVFIAANGTVQGNPCVYLDLYRVEDEKIAERWGFPDPAPPQSEWKNNNGML